MQRKINEKKSYSDIFCGWHSVVPTTQHDAVGDLARVVQSRLQINNTKWEVYTGINNYFCSWTNTTESKCTFRIRYYWILDWKVNITFYSSKMHLVSVQVLGCWLLIYWLWNGLWDGLAMAYFRFTFLGVIHYYTKGSDSNCRNYVNLQRTKGLTKVY